MPLLPEACFHRPKFFQVLIGRAEGYRQGIGPLWKRRKENRAEEKWDKKGKEEGRKSWNTDGMKVCGGFDTSSSYTCDSFRGFCPLTPTNWALHLDPHVFCSHYNLPWHHLCLHVYGSISVLTFLIYPVSSSSIQWRNTRMFWNFKKTPISHTFKDNFEKLPLFHVKTRTILLSKIPLFLPSQGHLKNTPTCTKTRISFKGQYFQIWSAHHLYMASLMI